jgi:hypothetical protein
MSHRETRRAQTSADRIGCLVEAMERRLMLTVTTVTQPLQVPYYNQGNTNWCWATSISMILRYYGYDRKPWQIAADFDKGPEAGLRIFQLGAFENYLETYYDRGVPDAWKSESFILDNNLVSRMHEVLAQGHPLWLYCSDAEHAVVATGFDGPADTDHVFINDPSGALTGYPLVQHQFTWSQFKNAIDTSFFSLFGDVTAVYAQTDALSELRSSASIQFASASGIVFASGAHSLKMVWDGSSPFAGYRYEPNAPGWYPADTDGAYDNYGFNATQADTIHLFPSFSNYTESSYSVRTDISVRRASDDAEVLTASSSTATLAADTFASGLAGTTGSVSLSTLPAGVYRLLVTLEGKPAGASNFEELDHNSFYFGVSAVAVPDSTPPTASLTSPANGGTIAQSTINANKYIDVTFSDASGIDGTSIVDSAPEFTLDGTAAGGVSISTTTPVLLSSTATTATYRYFLTGGGFGFGQVNLDFPADSFRDAAVAANPNDPVTLSFTVVAGPFITAVHPNPVTGSDAAQVFAVNGNDFVTGAIVRLTDKTNGGTFDKTPLSMNDNQINVSAIFTTAQAEWSVQVINPDGVGSNVVDFTVNAPAMIWTGAISQDWSTPGNWSEARVPTSLDLVIVNGGTVLLPDDPSFAELDINGGHVRVPSGTAATFAAGSVVRMVDGNGVSLVADAGGSLTLAGTTLLAGGLLGGFGDVRNTGTIEWTHGGIAGWDGTTSPGTGGVLTNLGTILISGSDVGAINANAAEGTALNNAGTIRQLGATFVPLYGGTLNNLAGGTYYLEGGGGFKGLYDANGTVNNAGLFVVSAGTATASVLPKVTFNNTGTVRVDSGTLDLQYQSSNSDGTFVLARDTTLRISAGTLTVSGANAVGGTGTLEVAGGRIEVLPGTTAALGFGATLKLTSGSVHTDAAGTLTIAGTTLLTGGLLGGFGDVRNTGTIEWTHGGIAGWDGTTSPGTGGALTNFGTIIISGSEIGAINAYDAEGFALNNVGTIRQLGGAFVQLYGGTSNNLPGGTYYLEGGGGFKGLYDANGTVNNSGLFVVSAGTATASVLPAVTFNNIGTVRVNSGTFYFNNANLRGAGTLALNVAGNNGAQAAHLALNGSAPMDQSISIVVDASFVPAPYGTPFSLVTFGSRVGFFHRIDGINLGGSLSLVPVYGDTALSFSTALLADANGDRSVDFNDLVSLAQNYNTSSGKGWADGDFTGDGNVDFNDLVKLAQNYNTSLPGASLPSLTANFSSDVAAAFALAAPKPAPVPARPRRLPTARPKPAPIVHPPVAKAPGPVRAAPQVSKATTPVRVTPPVFGNKPIRPRRDVQALFV